MIPFNSIKIFGDELKYISDAVSRDHISGNGFYSKLCNKFFKEKFNFKNVFLTTSCTDALEMTAMLLDIKEGDEIITPSFTFVSTANAFNIHGAKIIFADTENNFPNISFDSINRKISKKTRAIVIVHYAGFSCEISKIKKLCNDKKILLIEDCAHSINSKYGNKFLGTFGDFATFSFHETKNLTCGEGGLLVINNSKYVRRAEIIYEKGTNRKKFFLGQVSKYEWVDKGSSFLMSDINAAYLYAQLKSMDKIQKIRTSLVNQYIELIHKNKELSKKILLDKFINYKNNGHLFFIICKSLDERKKLILFLRKNNIDSAFHYLPLHKSKYYKRSNLAFNLKNTDKFSNRILRLPLHPNLKKSEISFIVKKIEEFFKIF